MNYLFTDYISRLAAKDTRLEMVELSGLDPPKDGILLIEEKQLDRLKEIEHRLSLVVLTEERNQETFETPHRILRAVYKYDTFQTVLSEVFQERHPITFFTTTLAALSHSESFTALSKLVQSETCCALDPEINSKSRLIYQNLSEPIHYLYTNVLDYLDPPVDYVENTVLDFASKNSVDVISMPLDSSVEAKLLTLCDVAVLLMTPDCIPDSNLLVERYPNIVLVCTDKIDGYNWIGDLSKLRDRIIHMRKEAKRVEVFGSRGD